MKTIILFISLILFSCINSYSQQDDASGSYEFALSFDSRTITIKARNTASTIRLKNFKPIANSHFSGLGFALKWSTKSNITLSQVDSKHPFHIMPTGEIFEIESKDEVYQILVFKDDAKWAPPFPQELMNGEWIDIATIPYSGTFIVGDRPEFVEYNLSQSTNAFFNVYDDAGNSLEYQPFLSNYCSYRGCLFADSRTVIVYQDSTKSNLLADVTIDKPTKATFKMMNRKGKTIKKEEHDLIEGINTIEIDISDLEKEMYMLKLIDGNALNYANCFTKE